MIHAEMEPSMVAEKRQILRDQQSCRFVDPDEYRSMLVSSQPLVRADEPEAGLRGLMNPLTGDRFVTEEERLFPRI